MTVSEPLNDPPADDIVGAAGSVRARTTFSRVLLVLAGTVIVLVGMRLAAPVLNPIIFAVVLSLLFSPIYAWLGRRGLPNPVAHVIMLVGLTLLFVAVMLDTFPETRWLASFMGISSANAEAET